MLIIEDSAQFNLRAIFEHANNAPPEVAKTLVNCFAFLTNYGVIREAGSKEVEKVRRVRIFSDFAPYSLGFTIEDNEGNFQFNGGIIYQGPESPADGSAPSFSVSLHNKVGWFIHT